MAQGKDPVAAAAQKYKPMQSVVPGTTSRTTLSPLKEKGWAVFLSTRNGEEGTERSSLASVLDTAIHLNHEGLDMMLETLIANLSKLLRCQRSKERKVTQLAF